MVSTYVEGFHKCPRYMVFLKAGNARRSFLPDTALSIFIMYDGAIFGWADAKT